MNNRKTNQNQGKVIIHSGSSQEWIDTANVQSVGEQLEDILQKLPRPDGDVVLLFSLTPERLELRLGHAPALGAAAAFAAIAAGAALADAGGALGITK